MLTGGEIDPEWHMLLSMAGVIRERMHKGLIPKDIGQKVINLAINKRIPPCDVEYCASAPLNEYAIEVLSECNSASHKKWYKLHLEKKASANRHQQSKRAKVSTKEIKATPKIPVNNNRFQILDQVSMDTNEPETSSPSCAPAISTQAHMEVPDCHSTSSTSVAKQATPIKSPSPAEQPISSFAGSTKASKDTITPKVQASQDQAISTQVKPPPIVLQPGEDWQELIREIETVANEQAAPICVGDQIKITFVSMIAYNKAIDFLKRNKIAFHTFSYRQNRPMKLVIKGLPSTTNPSKIETNLQAQLGNTAKVDCIRQLISRRNNLPLPIFFLCLTEVKGPKEHIYKLHHLMELPVRIEKYRKPKRTPICWNCGLFFHSSEECHRITRCCKCAGQHTWKDCTEAQEKCCNCLGNHSAFSTACPKHPSNKPKPKGNESKKKAMANSKQINKRQTNPPKLNEVEFPPLQRDSKKKTTNTKTTSIREKNHIPDEISSLYEVIKKILDQCGDLSIQDIILLLNETLVKFEEADSDAKKFTIAVEAITRLFSRAKKAT